MGNLSPGLKIERGLSSYKHYVPNGTGVLPMLGVGFSRISREQWNRWNSCGPGFPGKACLATPADRLRRFTPRGVP